jgi:hypothetical protein
MNFSCVIVPTYRCCCSKARITKPKPHRHHDLNHRYQSSDHSFHAILRDRLHHGTKDMSHDGNILQSFVLLPLKPTVRKYMFAHDRIPFDLAIFSHVVHWSSPVKPSETRPSARRGFTRCASYPTAFGGWVPPAQPTPAAASGAMGARSSA